MRVIAGAEANFRLELGDGRTLRALMSFDECAVRLLSVLGAGGVPTLTSSVRVLFAAGERFSDSLM